MKLSMEQLPQHLIHSAVIGLKPAYWVSGDEPLQQLEALDAIRAQARQQGYLEREILTVDKAFNWRALAEAHQNISLFSSRRLLELRLDSPKIGTEGSQALSAYFQSCGMSSPAGSLLLISSGRAESAVLNSAWVKALDACGVLIQVWPLQGPVLARWLEQRLSSRGFQMEAAAFAYFLRQVEGNLLAAAQEIDKLALYHAPGLLNLAQIQAVTTDHARYDSFSLVDAALAGAIGRSERIIASLKAEEALLPLILWSFNRDIRLLYSLSCQMGSRGLTAMQVLEQPQQPPLLARRKPLLAKALQQTPASRWAIHLQTCARLDNIIKGNLAGDGWLALQQLCWQIAMGQALVKADY